MYLGICSNNYNYAVHIITAMIVYQFSTVQIVGYHFPYFVYTLPIYCYKIPYLTLEITINNTHKRIVNEPNRLK